MRGTMADRLQILKDSVGHGHLVGSVEVNQIYAHYQHEGVSFYHPDGGSWGFLRNPLFEKSADRMQALAEVAILPEGSGIHQAMADAMENLSQDVFDRAPWEFGDLRESGHPVVTLDGEIIFDRAPHVPRLSEDELEEKNRLREKYDPDRYIRNGKHTGHTSPFDHQGAVIRHNLPPSLRPR